jgi:hypothetical protein
MRSRAGGLLRFRLLGTEVIAHSTLHYDDGDPCHKGSKRHDRTKQRGWTADCLPRRHHCDARGVTRYLQTPHRLVANNVFARRWSTWVRAAALRLLAAQSGHHRVLDRERCPHLDFTRKGGRFGSESCLASDRPATSVRGSMTAS